jgi:predicted lipid-binding transport protein (Tim44 family)
MPVDILILAAIAIFVVLRLRGVLGQKTGHFPPPDAQKDATRPEDRVVRLEHPTIDAQRMPDKKELAHILDIKAEPDLTLIPEIFHDKVKEIIAIDRNFTPKEFVEGARIAFEMILNAFNKQDRTTLKPLLNKETYDLFAAELDAQKTSTEKLENTLLAITSASVESVEISKSVARIQVHFVSEQNHITRSANGEIIEGKPSDITIVEDDWTFERDLRSPNPNWMLIAS